jgi:hypothetical protein
VRDSRYQGQFKDKVFMFKMFVDLVRSGIDVVNTCKAEATWKFVGSCLTILSNFASGLQWHATFVTTSIARFSLSHVVICKWKAPKPIWLFGII